MSIPEVPPVEYVVTALNAFWRRGEPRPKAFRVFRSEEEINSFINRLRGGFLRELDGLGLNDEVKGDVENLLNEFLSGYHHVLLDGFRAEHVAGLPSLRDYIDQGFGERLASLQDRVSAEEWNRLVSFFRRLQASTRAMVIKLLPGERHLILKPVEERSLPNHVREVLQESIEEHWRRLLEEKFRVLGMGHLKPDLTLIFRLSDDATRLLLLHPNSYILLSSNTPLGRHFLKALEEFREERERIEQEVLPNVLSRAEDFAVLNAMLHHIASEIEGTPYHKLFHPDVHRELLDNPDGAPRALIFLTRHPNLDPRVLSWILRRRISYDEPFFKFLEEHGKRSLHHLDKIYRLINFLSNAKESVLEIARRDPELVSELVDYYLNNRPEVLDPRYLKYAVQNLKDAELRDFLISMLPIGKEHGLDPEEAKLLFDHSKKLGTDPVSYARNVLSLSGVLDKGELLKLSSMLVEKPYLLPVLRDPNSLKRYVDFAGKPPSAESLIDILEQRSSIYGVRPKPEERPKKTLNIGPEELKSPRRFVSKISNYFNVVGGKVILRRELMRWLGVDKNVMDVGSFLEKVKRKNPDERAVQELRKKIEEKRLQSRLRRKGKYV